MNLLDEYTERIKYENGVFAMSMDGLNMEQVHMFAEQWQHRFGDKKALIIMPDDRDLMYAERFDFGIAFRLLRTGWKVTIQSESQFYLYYDQAEKKIMEQITPLSKNEPTEYIPDQEDLLSMDWIIYR
jgi:hypothetical protein